MPPQRGQGAGPRASTSAQDDFTRSLRPVTDDEFLQALRPVNEPSSGPVAPVTPGPMTGRASGAGPGPNLNSPSLPQSNFFGDVWSGLTEPLTNIPSRIASTIAEPMMQFGEGGDEWYRKPALYGGGFLQSLGNIGDQMTAPLDLAAGLGSGGASIAAKQGLPRIAKALTNVSRGASAPLALHGGMDVLEGNPSGLVEIGAGLLGMKQGVPKAKFKKIDPPTKTIDNTPIKPDEVDEWIKSIGGKPADDLELVDDLAGTTRINASGESAASLEALSRQSGMKAKGEQFVVYDKLGNKKPLIGPDAVDYQVRQGETYGVEGPNGFQVLDDMGGKFPKPKITASQAATNLKTSGSMLPPTKKPPTYEGVPLTPNPKSPKELSKGQRIFTEAFNLPRGLMASMDFSAPLRQGLGLIHKKEFWRALPSMFKAWSSEAGYQQILSEINSRPLFTPRIEISKRPGQLNKPKPSFAEESGLQLTDLKGLTNREEAIMSTWAEKVPGVRPSNRAYTAFLNKLRADTFESLIKDTKVLADVDNNMPLAKALADFVNTASGRGSLGKLESSAVTLNSLLFSPRLIASRLKMLNPAYYIMAPPPVRKEALKSLFAIGATGTMVNQLAQMAGAETSNDPNSADFGKPKIGNVRIDPWGGFQQYMVAFNRLIRPDSPNIAPEGYQDVQNELRQVDTGFAPLDLAAGYLGHGGQQFTSSTTGKTGDLWNKREVFDPTHFDIAKRFGQGKLHPVLGFIAALSQGQKELSGQEMNFGSMNPFENSISQRFIPIMLQDIEKLAQEDPSLLPLTILSAFGMPTQTYERRGR